MSILVSLNNLCHPVFYSLSTVATSRTQRIWVLSTNLASSYVDTSFCHPCYTFACVYLHRFQAHILLTKHLLCRRSISCLSKDPERTINKTFTDLIEVRHVWGNKLGSYPSVLSGKMFLLRPCPQQRHLKTIYFQIHLLLFDGLQKLKAQYMVQEEKHNILYFYQ